MNRQHTLRALRRNLRIWQAATVACVAVLLLGAGGLTMSSLRVNADDTAGEKVRMTVGTDDVFVIERDGTNNILTVNNADARFADGLRIGGATGPLILAGTADPEATSVAAPEGSLYLQTDGTLWVRGATSWGQAQTVP